MTIALKNRNGVAVDLEDTGVAGVVSEEDAMTVAAVSGADATVTGAVAGVAVVVSEAVVAVEAVSATESRGAETTITTVREDRGAVEKAVGEVEVVLGAAEVAASIKGNLLTAEHRRKIKRLHSIINDRVVYLKVRGNDRDCMAIDSSKICFSA